MKRNVSQSALTAMATLLAGAPTRAPHADVSNAGYLMGDVEDAYGDVEDAYGDVSTAPLDIWNTLIGDAEDDATIGFPRLPKLGPKGKKIAKIGGIAAAGVGAGLLVNRALRRRSQRLKQVRQTEAANARANTIQNQTIARSMLGQIPRNAKFPFYQIVGANLNQYPLAPTEHFVANDLRFNLDRQSTETPFESEIVTGTYAGVTWTMTTVGVVASRYYPCVFVSVGISTLTANPGTIFNVTGTFPLINGGTLTVATNPWSFTINQGWYAKLIVFPWVLVTNKPYLALGSYNAATPITVAITGLPANATTNLVVPGSAHPWTIGIRNAMV